MLKPEVRTATLTYCKRRSSENKNELKNLKIRIKKLNEKTYSSPIMKKEIKSLKMNLNTYIQIKLKVHK